MAHQWINIPTDAGDATISPAGFVAPGLNCGCTGAAIPYHAGLYRPLRRTGVAGPVVKLGKPKRGR